MLTELSPEKVNKAFRGLVLVIEIAYQREYAISFS
jgi:hypothetical protein